MALIIKTNGNTEPVEIPEDLDKQVDFLQRAVGGHFEAVFLSNNKIMIINEDGKGLRLPPNLQATMMADTISPYDHIVGDVVVAEKGEIQ